MDYFFTEQVELKRSRHHEKTLSQKIEDDFGEGQRFLKEQINTKHSNRGWKHGRRKSNSRKKSDTSSQSSSDEDGRHISGYEKRFKDFVKSHKCEGSPVYKKFLHYYKTATSNLQKKHNGSKYGTSWLQELANNSNSSACPNTCTNSIADDYTSTKKVQKRKKQVATDEVTLQELSSTTELPEA